MVALLLLTGCRTTDEGINLSAERHLSAKAYHKLSPWDEDQDFVRRAQEVFLKNADLNYTESVYGDVRWDYAMTFKFSLTSRLKIPITKFGKLTSVLNATVSEGRIYFSQSFDKDDLKLFDFIMNADPRKIKATRSYELQKNPAIELNGQLQARVAPAGCYYSKAGWYMEGETMVVVYDLTCDFSSLFDDQHSTMPLTPNEINPEGGGAGGGYGGGYDYPDPTDWANGNSELMEALRDNPFALIEGPCALLTQWLATARHTVSQDLLNKLNSIVKTSNSTSSVTPGGFTTRDVAHVQKLNDAYSQVVNMDYFPVTVSQLPLGSNGQRMTPEQFLNYIRTNINSFVDTSYSTFTPYNDYGYNDNALWNSSNPLGAIIKIDIKGPFNGSVIVSGYSSNKWTFTTIHEPVYGDHPVSGNRDFGFVKNSNGSYTFYTRGVDRLTSSGMTSLQNFAAWANTDGLSPLAQADKLWTSFQEKVEAFIKAHQGSANLDIAATVKGNHPDWTKVQKALYTNNIGLLNKNCK